MKEILFFMACLLSLNGCTTDVINDHSFSIDNPVTTVIDDYSFDSLPSSCVRYTDGCNTCIVGGGCTEMDCVYSQPKYECLERESDTKFAWTMYDALKKEFNDENIFFSPYSIKNAMVMAAEGANGQTQEEILDALKVNDLEEERLFLGDLLGKYNNNELSVANSFWMNPTFDIKDSYSKFLANSYDALVSEFDLTNGFDGARVVINAWVEDKTNGLIVDLIPKGMIDPDTAAVIVNAIHFKADWLTEFDSKNTTKKDFTKIDGEIVSTDIMFNVGDYKFAKSEEMKLIELPYVGEDFSMLVALPNEYSGDFNIDEFERLRNSLVDSKVELSLPKFNVDGETISLKDSFKDFGVNLAFTSDADFSDITNFEVYIEEILHQAEIIVDEKGTEAAAATAVIIGRESLDVEPEREIFNANKPFLYMVVDNDNGEILFMGEMLDPK